MDINRLAIEQFVYQRYYRKLISALSPFVSENFKVLLLPKHFLKAENFLSDGIHLSEKGHKELAQLIEAKIDYLLHD